MRFHVDVAVLSLGVKRILNTVDLEPVYPTKSDEYQCAIASISIRNGVFRGGLSVYDYNKNAVSTRSRAVYIFIAKSASHI